MYKLYFAPGSAAMAPHAMLQDIGAPFELIRVDTKAGEQRSADYLKLNPHARVPTVARVDPDFTLALNPAEVDDAFEVPLAFLMQPDNHQRHSRDWKGMRRTFYAMPFGERYIWGVTAGILRNLYERLYAP